MLPFAKRQLCEWQQEQVASSRLLTHFPLQLHQEPNSTGLGQQDAGGHV